MFLKNSGLGLPKPVTVKHPPKDLNIHQQEAGCKNRASSKEAIFLNAHLRYYQKG